MIYTYNPKTGNQPPTGQPNFYANPDPRNTLGHPNFYNKEDPFMMVGGLRINVADLNRELLDPSKFEYLKGLGGDNASAGQIPSQYFNELTKTIGAPSGVDEASRSLEQDYIKQVLSDIDTDTRKAAGTATMDYADLGQLGGGANSSIAQNAIAQIMAQGARNKAGARTQLGFSELARQKERENALRNALTTRYQAGVSGAESSAGRGMQGGMAYGDILNTNRNKYYDQLLNSVFNIYSGERETGLQGQRLSAEAIQNALGRTSSYELGSLNKSQQGGGSYLMPSIYK